MKPGVKPSDERRAVIREHTLDAALREVAEGLCESLVVFFAEAVFRVLVEARFLERRIGAVEEDEVPFFRPLEGVLEIPAEDGRMGKSLFYIQEETSWRGEHVRMVRGRVVIALGVQAEEAVEAVLGKEDEHRREKGVVIPCPHFLIEEVADFVEIGFASLGEVAVEDAELQVDALDIVLNLPVRVDEHRIHIVDHRVLRLQVEEERSAADERFVVGFVMFRHHLGEDGEKLCLPSHPLNERPSPVHGDSSVR